MSIEEDDACEIVNGEPDANPCIYVNESLTKQNRELLRIARETAKEKQYLYKGYTVKDEVRVKQHEKGDHVVNKSSKNIDKI